MIIRLHLVNQGQPLDLQRVTSRSPRVIGATRNGHVELTILPQGQGRWARSVAVAHARQHEPLLEQVAALAALVERAGNENGSDASRAAEKHAAILAQAHELASSIGDASVAMADKGMRRVEREAYDGVRRARRIIRRHPLRSVGLAALAGALWAGVLRR